MFDLDPQGSIIVEDLRQRSESMYHIASSPTRFGVQKWTLFGHSAENGLFGKVGVIELFFN